MKRLRLKVLPVSVLLALPALVAAQTDATTLKPVTVSDAPYRADLAPQSPRNAYRTTESSSNHVQVIGREEIEQLRPKDVFDLLNSATGVIATQGSRKGFSGLTVRGDSNFRWIIDGTMLQPTMASRIVKALPVMAIEEVKVVRGGSALTLGPLTGSASPGGAPVDGFVVIRTRMPAKDEGQARLAVESFDTVQADVWVGKQLGGESTKGYIAGVVSRADTNGPSDKLDNGAAYNQGRENTAGLVKGGFETAGWLVDLMAYQDDGSFQIPNANSHGTGQGSWYMDPSRTSIYSVTGSKAWTGQHTTLFGLTRAESKQKFWTANTAAGPYSAVQNDNLLTHFYLRHNVDLGATKVAVGLDRVHWDAPNGQQYYEGIHREEKTNGWFAQVEHKLANGIALDGSYRRDRVHVVHGLDYYIGGAQPPGGVNSPLRYQNRTLPAASFLSLGAAYDLSKEWKLAARYSQGKQPVQGGLNPAPGVKFGDDEQKKWELGVEGKLSALFNPSVNFFQRKVVNEKSVVGYTYKATNNSTQTCRAGAVPATGALSLAAGQTPLPCYGQADTQRAGIELATAGNFSARSSYRASLTHFTSLSNSANGTTPENILDVSVSHGWGAYTLTGAIKHVASYKGSTTDTTAWLGGYTRLDLGLGYDFKLGKNAARLSVYGRNLTDKRYETSNGVQDVGRTLGVEFTTAF
ncbi:MAG TPA: TonB-dependent receptor [Burkholderiaceae bacterium]|nr:TonB-dependent receptor [Burkholderiaceae bacterium]